MKKHFSLVLLLVIVICLTAAAQRQGGGVAVSGLVVDRQERPAPGLAVFLVCQQGKNGPSITDRYGHFLFTNIPSGQSYFIEVYWGRDLMYRQPIRVNADTNLGTIRL